MGIRIWGEIRLVREAEEELAGEGRREERGRDGLGTLEKGGTDR